MFAPAHHPAMKNVGPTRVELGTRTIFNLLGPLSNPAGVKRQMVGVFSRQWVEPIAQVLKNLGSERAWVVHGSDGLDEITTSGPTSVAALENGTVRTFEITPEDVGLPRGQARGAARRRRAGTTPRRCSGVLEGKKAPSATSRSSTRPPALVVAGKAKDLQGRRRRSPPSRRFRRSRRPARSPDRGVERAMADILRQDRSLQARGDRRGQARRARSPRSKREAKAAPPPRGFLRAIEQRLAAGITR